MHRYKLDLLEYRLSIRAKAVNSNLFDFRREEKMPTSICPECNEEVYVELDAEQGDRVSCEECGATLIVVGLDPIELDLREEPDKDDIADDAEFGSYELDDSRY